MKRTLTVSALALALAGLGAASGLAQQTTAPAANAPAAQDAHWRGDNERGWRDGRRGRGGEERFGRGGRHDRGDRGGRHGGRRDGGGMLRGLQAFDANSDGAITQAEIDQFRQGQITRFDADGNGTLSVEEYQALWLEQMRERMVDAFQEHDDDGNGQVTAEEFNERYAGLVERLDRNGDGQLSPDDRRRGNRRAQPEQAPAQPGGNAAPQPGPGATPAPAPAPL